MSYYDPRNDNQLPPNFGMWMSLAAIFLIILFL